MRFTWARCASGARRRNQSSTTLRQTEVQERILGSSTRNAIHFDFVTQRSMAARLASLRALSAEKPPADSAHLSPSIASSTASIDGVLMVSSWKMFSANLPFEVRRKIFGSGQAGL